MRKALFLGLIVAFAMCGVAIAADKIGTFGAPNASGTYPMEVKDDKSITVASDATFTVSGTTAVAAITATSAEIDGTLVTDGTIYTAKIVADGAVYVGTATLDPCPGLGAGYIFFNTTKGAPCFCNSYGVDLMIYDGSTACF